MIREYIEADFNSVNVIGRDINANFNLIFSPASKCYVYVEDDMVVGFVLFDILQDRAEIIDIGVLLLYRNRKIGDKLLKHALNVCKDNGCESMTLEVRVDNTLAIKLYKANDFKVLSVRKRYYSNGDIDAYLMSRKL